MPVSSDPNDTIPVVLRTDQAKFEKAKAAGGDAVPADPPTFHVKFATAREARRIRELIRQADAHSAKGEDEQAETLMDQAIAIGAARWVGVKDAAGATMTPADNPASSFLSGTELWELAYATRGRPVAAEEELRNFAPPSVGNGGSSVPATTAPTV